MLAVPFLTLFLVPFLIQAAEAFQLNRGNYGPAVTQTVNRPPLNGINGSNFSTNRFNHALNGINGSDFSTNRFKYAPNGIKGSNFSTKRFNYASSGVNRSNSFSTIRSSYAPTVTGPVNPGVSQTNNRMYRIPNKLLNINALRRNQTFRQNIGVPRNNATNLNRSLTITTGVNGANSNQKNVNKKVDLGARGKKF